MKHIRGRGGRQHRHADRCTCECCWERLARRLAGLPPELPSRQRDVILADIAEHPALWGRVLIHAISAAQREGGQR